MLAYDLVLLSEYELHEYRYNIAMNMTGGIRNCIANDNLVEIYVHRVKESMRAMGANVSYTAARKVAKCIDVLNDMSDNLSKPRSGKHSESKSMSDVLAIATCLLENDILVH